MSRLGAANIPSRRRTRVTGRQHGQSLVEFVLTISIMLVLVVAVSDLGRIFAAGLLLEAAARDAAEVGANAYLADPPGNPPGPLNTAAPAPGDSNYDAADYSALRLKAARTACAEARELPNTLYESATTDCPGMPLTLVCVHDGQDPGCANEVNGFAIPSECTDLTTAPTNAAGAGSSRYVEVRLCYRFDSIVDVPLVSFGTFWLQRSRTFVIACYLVFVGDEECG